jgi:predicted XRE-type DNA-binding protein
VRHLNDDVTNNCVENLAWGSQQDNMQDARRNGRISLGERRWNTKLRIQDITEIRRLYATGDFTQKELAERFGVNFQQISKIIRRQSWEHVS